jgi:hypothetical protein
MSSGRTELILAEHDPVTRLLRLLAVAVFLASALIGTAAQAHGGHAATATPLAGATQDHAAHHPGKAGGETPDSGKNDRDAACHSAAAGCPGCLVITEQGFAAPGVTRLTFHHFAEDGRSVDPGSHLRPPIFS